MCVEQPIATVGREKEAAVRQSSGFLLPFFIKFRGDVDTSNWQAHLIGKHIHCQQHRTTTTLLLILFRGDVDTSNWQAHPLPATPDKNHITPNFVFSEGWRVGGGAMETMGGSGRFERERHLCYLEMMLQLLPSEYESQEINRLTLAYFVICGLDLLGALDQVDKDQVATWILSFQAYPSKVGIDNGQFYGFHGSRTSQYPLEQKVSGCNASHLASTYCALAILKIIGYDFSSFDYDLILISMKNLQQPDGSFMPIHIGAETDLRFVYCAAAICSLLNDWRGIDIEKAKEYIIKCQSYDGGFGLVPGSESHGGATYCAVAALHLMGYFEADHSSNSRPPSLFNASLLLEWALQRQAADGGFQGRANKPSDTCYAFWVCGVLKILGADHFFDRDGLRRFLLSCQSKYGGFTKFPGTFLPDLYHSYYGFAAFSLLEEPGLNRLNVELGLTALLDLVI